MSHRGNASQYKLLFHLSDAKTFWKMYSLTEFSRKSYLCCGRYILPVYKYSPLSLHQKNHRFSLFSMELLFEIPIHEICAKYLDLNSDLMHWSKVLQYWHKYNLFMHKVKWEKCLFAPEQEVNLYAPVPQYGFILRLLRFGGYFFSDMFK